MSETIVKLIREFDALVLENRAMREELDRVGAAANGEQRANRPKLSDLDVQDIRAAYRGGMAQYQLADNYGVNPATISRIVRGLYH